MLKVVNELNRPPEIRGCCWWAWLLADAGCPESPEQSKTFSEEIFSKNNKTSELNTKVRTVNVELNVLEMQKTYFTLNKTRFNFDKVKCT
jgi:hypothetical protein